MRKTIVVGSLFAACILLGMPGISSVYAQFVQPQQLQQQFTGINVEDLLKKYSTDGPEPNIILLTLLIILLKMVRIGVILVGTIIALIITLLLRRNQNNSALA